MMRSMFAAISGLKVHQTMMDVVANDIANVNTIGYKASRASFKDTLSQMVRSGSGATSTLGGTNAAQVGLGVQLSSIDNMMQSGAIQSTGSSLDLALQGDGFFRVAAWDTATSAFGQNLYTRAGNFTRDKDGYLETPDGYYVIGYKATNGVVDTPLSEQRIKIDPTAKSVSIGSDGVVTAVDSAGVVTKDYVISLAKFANDAGLERVSGTKFQSSSNSGTITNGVPGDTNGLGTIASGSVEMSNVDLAAEFTNMITAQRGFQANSRVISTADDMLQELVNLKR
jgi:flagellar hook protein FlgE